MTHLASLTSKIDGAKLIGLYDDDPQRRKTWADSLKTQPFEALSALLALKPNLVLIGAVPSDRAGLAEQALAAGCNVLIDKPLALDRVSLERVKAAQRKSGNPAIVFYPMRGLPLVAAAKQAVQSGRIGRLVRILASGPHWLHSMPPRPDWHWMRSTNGDILLDIGSHYFDFCCWWTGSAPIDIASRMGNYNVPEHPEFRDFGFSHRRFPDGAVAYIDVDWLIVPRAETAADTHIWIQGTKGKIDLFFGKQTIRQTWTEGYFEPLAPAEKSPDDWTIELMRDVAQGKPCAIGHVQPASVPGRVNDLDFFDQSSGFGRVESLVQTAHAMRVEVVHHQRHLPGPSIVHIDQSLQPLAFLGLQPNDILLHNDPP